MQETQETRVWTLGREDPLEEEIPWTEEPGELQSTGSQRIKHDRMNEHAFWVREDCWCHHWIVVCYASWARGSVLGVGVPCLLDPCRVTCSSHQACGPAGEHTTWRADSLTKWHPGPHVLGESCSLQTWTGRAHEITSLAATWMDMEIIIGSEGSQTKTNIIRYHLFAKSEKKWYRWTYLQNWNRLTDLENKFMGEKKRKQTYNSQRGNVEGGINWEFGIDIYTWTHCIAWAARWL